MKITLPAEWEPQTFVQLTWPNENTDWAPYLDDALSCYNNIAEEIRKREPLYIFKGEINDTWARDHAFITTRVYDSAECRVQSALVLNDFCFNGWGLKFAANLDNQINRKALKDLKALNDLNDPKALNDLNDPKALNALNDLKAPKALNYNNLLNIILEGGSIESDGRGTILTTSDCLLAPNRNNYQTKEEAEAMLKEHLGAERILWLDNVGLTGDDTDSHIDTIARLCPNDIILYIYEDTDKSVQSYGLKSMKAQLEAFRTADGKPYRLLALPMPRLVEYDGEILPATYANFLIINGAVLVPTYGQSDKDAEAMAVIQQAFPDREIVGIDCQVLVRQHGSLHCITMQYPEK